MTNTDSIKPLAEDAVSVIEKVSFLKQPEAYPHAGAKVETKETHMSWIFLTDNTVYKLKKPVVFPFLDFRTLEARLKNCREELRLNKRLATGIYIGVVPLVLNEEGKLQLEGKGQIVDWLVKMKRIPEENLLDYAIKHKQVGETLIKKAAEVLVRFYRAAPPVQIDPDLYKKKLKDEIISTHTELLLPQFYFPVVLIEQISNNLVQFLRDHSVLFEERIVNGKIIEGHGDLKPEHICLLPDPAFIDALEFNWDLRIMDIAEELSFLDMECEMMGDLTTGKLFFDYYQKLSGDAVPEPLTFFYKAKKAFTRTYLVARHIIEPDYKDEPKWLNKANAYLQLAKKYNAAVLLK